MELQIDKFLSFSEFKYPLLLYYGTDAMKRRVRREIPEILVLLAQSVISVWENLPDNLIRNAVESWIQQCIRKRGGHTGY